MYPQFAILAVFAFLFALVSGRLERTVVSPPMVYIAFGLLVGPLGLGWLGADVTDTQVRALCDFTLAFVLFADAARADFGVLRTNARLPLRMLAVGLPLAILLGTGAGALLFPEFGFAELAVLATMLAATDAALGKAVIVHPAVPARLREALNLESGLNDGLAVPLLLLFLSLAGSAPEADPAALIGELVLHEVGIGVLVGCSVTGLGTLLARRARALGWIAELWRAAPVVMLAAACFALAQNLGGSGYIAAFVGGLVFGRMAGQEARELVEDSEQVGELLAMLTWIVFGSAVLAFAAPAFELRDLAFAALALLVVRPAAIVLSLTGSEEGPGERAFLGWFGPRGLASIAFAVIVLNADLEHGRALTMIAVTTVFLSAFLHGLSANPLARRFGAGATGHGTGVAESADQ